MYVGAIDPEWNNAALITIDVQNDTLDGRPLEVPGTTAALSNMATVCRSFRIAARPIVHIVRLYNADGSNAELSRRELVSGPVPMFRSGEPGRRIASELLPAGAPVLDDELLLAGEAQALGVDEVAIYKPRWGAFYRTALNNHLRGLGVTTLVFTGCNFPNCPRTSIYEASERDYRIVLATDAVSGLYDRGRDELTGIGVTLMTADEVKKHLA